MAAKSPKHHSGRSVRQQRTKQQRVKQSERHAPKQQQRKPEDTGRAAPGQTSARDSVLAIALELPVMLRIAELQAMSDEVFASTWQRWIDEALVNRAFASEAILFGGKRGEAAEAYNQAAKVIAALSFAPGGIFIFGVRWESKRPARPSCGAGGRGGDG